MIPPLALFGGKQGASSIPPEILAFETFSQDELMSKWGGVVPEIAARNHLEKLVPLLKKNFAEAKVDVAHLDAIAVTTRPGLLGPLLTGLNGAKTLSLLFKTPIISVNHLHAHIEAIHLHDPVSYPYLGMIVSGGHGLYVVAHSPSRFDILGKTLDDAPGEAFDKGGKMMGLGYPAGPMIDTLAAKAKKKNGAVFPIGLKSSANANLSFSGVKTAMRVYVQRHGVPEGEGTE